MATVLQADKETGPSHAVDPGLGSLTPGAPFTLLLDYNTDVLNIPQTSN